MQQKTNKQYWIYNISEFMMKLFKRNQPTISDTLPLKKNHAQLNSFQLKRLQLHLVSFVVISKRCQQDPWTTQVCSQM